jgi:hypothetical protein
MSEHCRVLGHPTLDRMGWADNRDTHAASLGGRTLCAVPSQDKDDTGLGKVENREDYPG